MVQYPGTESAIAEITNIDGGVASVGDSEQIELQVVAVEASPEVEPLPYLGTHPRQLLAGGFSVVNSATVGLATGGLEGIASMPVRLAAFGSISGELVRLSWAAGGVVATTLVDLTVPRSKPRVPFEDAVS